MLDFIHLVHVHLAEQGTSVNTIVALFFGLIAFILAGYLIESEINKGKKRESSND